MASLKSQMLAAVLDCPVGTAQTVAVCVALYRYMDIKKEGGPLSCWTAVETIAEQAKTDARTARIILKALCDAGGLIRTERVVKGLTSSPLWTFVPDRWAAALETVPAALATSAKARKEKENAKRAPALVVERSVHEQRSDTGASDALTLVRQRSDTGAPHALTPVGEDSERLFGEGDSGSGIRRTGGAAPSPPVLLGADPDGPCQVCGHIIAAGCRHGVTGPLGADPGLSVTEGLLFHHRPSEAVQPPPATTDIAPTPRKASKATGAPAKGNGKPPPADPSEVAKVWAFYRRWHPLCGEDVPKAFDVAGSVREIGARATALIVQWAHTSDDEQATFLRNKDKLGDTLFRPSHRGEYSRLSSEWEERGRKSRPRTETPAETRQRTADHFDRFLAGERLNTVDADGNPRRLDTPF